MRRGKTYAIEPRKTKLRPWPSKPKIRKGKKYSAVYRTPNKADALKHAKVWRHYGYKVIVDKPSKRKRGYMLFRND